MPARDFINDSLLPTLSEAIADDVRGNKQYLRGFDDALKAITRFLEELYVGVAQLTSEVEIIVVNDGSRDHTSEEILNVCTRLPVQYVELSRNFGKEIAIQAGLDAANGDCVVIMDADFQHPVEAVASMVERGPCFDYVVTVCDETSAERCPVFPGDARRLHWPFADPSSFTGTQEEKLSGTRHVRDQIRQRITEWIAAPGI